MQVFYSFIKDGRSSLDCGPKTQLAIQKTNIACLPILYNTLWKLGFPDRVTQFQSRQRAVSLLPESTILPSLDIEAFTLADRVEGFSQKDIDEHNIAIQDMQNLIPNWPVSLIAAADPMLRDRWDFYFGQAVELGIFFYHKSSIDRPWERSLPALWRWRQIKSNMKFIGFITPSDASKPLVVKNIRSILNEEANICIWSPNAEQDDSEISKLIYLAANEV